MKIPAYTKWDAIPVFAGSLHFAYVLTLFFIFPHAPWWLLLGMGLIYSTIAIGVFIDWKFWVYFLPFYDPGHCASYLNGYFLHYGGNPDKPIAWGVSSYDKLYNFLWFNNGCHAEHHFRPKLHWTKMKPFHHEILEVQRREGVRVIVPPHALGFFDPALPPRKTHRDSFTEEATPKEETTSSR